LKKYTLVIIDMQSDFSACDRALKGVNQAVKKAKIDRCPIVVVEFRNCKRTLKEVRNTIGEYKNVYRVTKPDCDGSKQIISAVKKHNLPNNLMFCGVETGVCVKQSIHGLINVHAIKPSQLYLINNATASHLKGSQKRSAVKSIKNMGINII